MVDVPGKTFQKLRTIFDATEYLDRCPSIFAHLEAVATYVQRFNVQRRIFVCPLSGFNDKFYRNGMLFQCLYDTKRRNVFAAGGRYDALIQDHRPRIPRHSSTCHAVGFNLGWEKLCASMARLQKGASKTYLKKAVDELRGRWAVRRVATHSVCLDGG